MSPVTIKTPQTLSGGFATTAQMYESSERIAAREKNGVELIPVNTEGELIGRLTAPYYGYCYSPTSHETGLFAKPSFLGFEVHRAKSGEVFILGYAKVESVKAVEAGKETVTLDLYPVGTNEAVEFIQVPRARISNSKSLDRQNFNRLALTVVGN